MPTNSYFNYGVRSEQHLYEDLIIESLKIYGQDVYYLPRKVVEEDRLMNEEILSKFDASYMIEMYLKDMDGFGGEGTLLSKFGLEQKNQCTFVVSKRRWLQFVGIPNNEIDQERPFEGDLIYHVPSKSLFEIRYVQHEIPFYQLNQFPVYELSCELFVYENQSVNTGVKEIDNLESENMSPFNVMITTINGIFKNNEKVILTDLTTDSTINAEIKNIFITNTGDKVYSLTNVTYPGGTFIDIKSGFEVMNESATATGVIGTIIGLDHTNYDKYNEPVQDNDLYKKKLPDFIDFTVDNPFGDV